MTEPLSLSPIRSFLWTARALQERGGRNLSAGHLDVALAIQKLVEAGTDQFTHKEVAVAARCCPRTVGEATRRLRAIGLLGWEAQYIAAGGHRRRRENRYWLKLPLGLPIPRPELRGRPAGRFCRASREEKKTACEQAAAGPLPGFEARFAAKLSEERRLRRTRVVRIGHRA